jgi:hypothetical protein
LSGVDDLVQWLRAQLDEDERIARAASEYAEASWQLDEDGETVLWWPPEPHVAEKEREKGLPVVSDRWRGQTIASDGTRIAPHIARHDPARVLRDIDAKRGVITGLQHLLQDDNPFVTSQADDALRLLALPYADRPGYREEWRP